MAGNAGPDTLDRDGNAALGRDLRGHAPKLLLQALDHRGIVVADLEQHLCASRDDARRAGIKRDAAGGPHRAWSAQFWKALVDRNAKPRQREPRILANFHPGGAGMILLAGKGDRGIARCRR